MQPLVMLMDGLAAFTASALLLGIIASVVVIAAERMLRPLVNSTIFLDWLSDDRWVLKTDPYVDRAWWRLFLSQTRVSMSLPPRQFAGALSSLLQASYSSDGLSSADSKGPQAMPTPSGAGSANIRDIFAFRGAQLLGTVELYRRLQDAESEAAAETTADAPSPREQIEGYRSLLADRALDDFQAMLVNAWERRRYGYSAAATILLFGLLVLAVGPIKDITIFGTVYYVAAVGPALFVVTMATIPIVRDALSRLTLENL
jgi:hypothetical protein